MISAEVTIRTQFYDLDPMNIVWHGNYVRYLEQARSALLGEIGYSYREMKEYGFAWQIVDLSIRYVRPLQLYQDFVVPTSGACPACIVCIPIRNVWARTPAERTAVAMRPVLGERRAKCRP